MFHAVKVAAPYNNTLSHYFSLAFLLDSSVERKLKALCSLAFTKLSIMLRSRFVKKYLVDNPVGVYFILYDFDFCLFVYLSNHLISSVMR